MDCSFILDAPSGVPRQRIQIAKLGNFKDSRYGEFSFERRHIEEWQRNLAKLPGARAPVDLDHSPEKGGNTEAAGWITGIELSAAGVPEATVEWTPLGESAIRDKRYLFFSPTIAKDYKDETGASHGSAVIGGALTNRPFLNMPTVCLSRNLAITVEPTQAYSLDIGTESREKYAVIVKTIDGKTQHMFPIPPGDKIHAEAALRLLPHAISAGHITQAEAAKVRARAHAVLGTSDTRRVMSIASETAQVLGLPEDANETTILEAVKALREGTATPDAKTLAAAAEVTGHVLLSRDEAQTLRRGAEDGARAAAALHEMRFARVFEKAANEGKVAAGQRETYAALFERDPDAVEKLLTEAPVVVKMLAQGETGKPLPSDPQLAAEHDVDAQVKALMSAQNITYAAAWAKLAGVSL